MRIDPIIPIWVMAILCIAMLLFWRNNWKAYARQIIAVILIFCVNLRIMVPSDNVTATTQELDTYVLFVVDDTLSMLARDYDGDTERLTAVKNDCEKIIDKMDGAKFAVISFNNNANLVAPYTDNSDYAKSVIESLYPLESLYAKGSSLNICKDVMIDTLKRAHEKGDGNVIVFFISDGEITSSDSRLESFDEASKYADGGAVLGYGTEKGGRMYVKSYYSDQEEVLQDTSSYPYKDAVSRIDEKNLKQIAGDIGVKYINMNDGQSRLEDVVNDAVKNSGGDSASRQVSGYVDIYYIFVAAFAGLMIYEFWSVRKKNVKISEQ